MKKNKKILSYILASTMIASVSVPTFISTYALASEGTEVTQVEDSNDEGKNLQMQNAKINEAVAEVASFKDFEKAIKNESEVNKIVVTESFALEKILKIDRSLEIVTENNNNIELTISEDFKVTGNDNSLFSINKKNNEELKLEIKGLKFKGNDKDIRFADIEKYNASDKKQEKTITLDDCIFSDFNGVKGSVILAEEFDNITLNIKDCYFNNNKSREGGGNALHISSGDLKDGNKKGTLNINSTKFIDNENTLSNGGAISTYGPINFNLNNAEFKNNKAHTQGGAISIYNQNDNIATLNIDTSKDKFASLNDSNIKSKFKNNMVTIDENLSSESSGGAIDLVGNVEANINDTGFEDNKAIFGGAINLEGIKKLESINIVDGVFKSNTAKMIGGAINLLPKDKDWMNSSVVDISDKDYFNVLKTKNSVFENNRAEKGVYKFDKSLYEQIYEVYKKNIIDTVSLSDPAVLVNPIEDSEFLDYNNYDISFVGDSKIVEDFLKVTYDANAKDFTGNVPEDTNKYKNDDMVTVLDSGDLSREGYTFEGWNTKADGTGTPYKSEGTFNIKEDTTLYAQWKKESGNGGGTELYYEVTYDANAKDFTGKVPEDSNKYEKDDEVTVLDSGDLSRKGYIFKGWNTKADGSGTSYKSEDKFNITEDTTLYAQWEKEVLDKLNHNAYLIGYPDGTVQPDGNITRGEVSAIYFRLLTEEARKDYWKTDNKYTDVSKEAWYNNEVSTLSNLGVIKGYPAGDFKPDGDITRAEFASMTARFLADKVKATNGKLNDIEGHWAKEDINRLVAEGIIEGYGDGSFKPEQNITRAEAARIVNGILERTPHKDGLLEDMKLWPDNNEKAWYYLDIQEATNTHEYERETNKDPEKWTKILPNRDWTEYEKEYNNK